jgi:hypothetical protein
VGSQIGENMKRLLLSQIELDEWYIAERDITGGGYDEELEHTGMFPCVVVWFKCSDDYGQWLEHEFVYLTDFIFPVVVPIPELPLLDAISQN